MQGGKTGCSMKLYTFWKKLPFNRGYRLW